MTENEQFSRSGKLIFRDLAIGKLLNLDSVACLTIFITIISLPFWLLELWLAIPFIGRNFQNPSIASKSFSDFIGWISWTSIGISVFTPIFLSLAFIFRKKNEGITILFIGLQSILITIAGISFIALIIGVFIGSLF